MINDSKKKNTDLIIEIFTSINIIGLLLVLAIALALQFWLKELPCPLCLLQRIGFIGIMISLTLILQFGYQNRHIGITLLFALFTSFVALRQIALHVVPGTGSYGGEVFGLHLYSWSFLIAIAIIINNALFLILNANSSTHSKISLLWKKVNKTLLFIVCVITIINVATTFFECGFKFCPDNPTIYEFFPNLIK